MYPVKSMRGLDREQATLEPWGFADDRRWAVLATSGEEVTAREVPTLLRFGAHPTPGGLRLSYPGQGELEVTRPTRGATHTSDWIGRTRAADATASKWVSGILGREVVLVHQADPGADRSIQPKHGGRGHEPLNLADAAPLLLTTEASLRRLDQLVAQMAAERDEPIPAPLSMVRFRPNIVVDGDAPFAEHGWRQLRIGEVQLRFAEDCDRCVLPTYDPDTLAHGVEPTRTLARYRRWDGKVWFGIRVIPQTTGTLRIGDEVDVEVASPRSVTSTA